MLDDFIALFFLGLAILALIMSVILFGVELAHGSEDPSIVQYVPFPCKGHPVEFTPKAKVLQIQTKCPEKTTIFEKYILVPPLCPFSIHVEGYLKKWISVNCPVAIIHTYIEDDVS